MIIINKFFDLIVGSRLINFEQRQVCKTSSSNFSHWNVTYSSGRADSVHVDPGDESDTGRLLRIIGSALQTQAVHPVLVNGLKCFF